MNRRNNWTSADRRHSRTAAAGLLVVALTIPFASRAMAAHPVHLDVLSRATVDDRISIKTKSASEVITYRVELQPGAATPWHYHPGPHLVSIASGAVTVYEEDCGTTTYPTGQGFFDPGGSKPHRQHVHVARNDGSEPAVLLVTDVRAPGAPLRVDVPAPAVCF